MVLPATPDPGVGISSARLVRFGVFEVDVRARELRKQGRKVRLAHQPFGVLELLLERSGDVVTREDLRRRLWSADTFVDFDLSLNSAVRKLRDALGDSAEHPAFIETLPRVGYRFIAPVERPAISPDVAERWVQGFVTGLASLERPPISPGVAEREASGASPVQRRIRPLWAAMGLLAVGVALIVPSAGGWWTRPGISPVVSREASDLYDRGNKERGRVSVEGNRAALLYFKQAVALQHDFARAYASLALTWVQFFYGGDESPDEVIKNAEEAAYTALALDPTLEEAYQALALTRRVQGDLAGEDEAIDEMLKLVPRSARSLRVLAQSHLSRHQFEQAVTAAEHAREADPWLVNGIVLAARAHRAARDYELAIELLQGALQTDGDRRDVGFQLAATYILKGDIKAGIVQLEKLVERDNPRFASYLGYAYALDGRIQEARGILQKLLARRKPRYVSSFGIALIYDALGEETKAREALDRAFREHAVEFTLLDTYPKFDTLVAHPGYKQRLGH